MNTLKSLVAISTLLFVSANSFAISLSYSGLFNGTAHILNTKLNATNHTSYVGVLKFTDSSSNQFLTLCADLGSGLDGSYHSYNSSMTNPSGSTGIDLAGGIVSANLQSSISDITASGNDKRAGLQLAVWSAIYDNGANFNANGTHFKVLNANAATLAYASSYYDNVSGAARYFQSSQGGAQSQLTVDGVTSAPEPAAFGFLAMGAVGALARRKYGKKSTR